MKKSRRSRLRTLAAEVSMSAAKQTLEEYRDSTFHTSRFTQLAAQLCSSGVVFCLVNILIQRRFFVEVREEIRPNATTSARGALRRDAHS